jgi:plasmid stabilization system protein ParE
VRLLIRAEAVADIEQIRNRYADLRPDLAVSFDRTLRDLIDRIMTHPEAYPLAYDDVRRALTRRPYRYVVAYRVEDEAVIVTACVHTAQDFRPYQSRR